MTIASTGIKVGPVEGNGVTVDYPFTFKTFDTADIEAYVTDDATGTARLQVLDTDYTVVLNADQDVSPGGTLTMLTALTAGNWLQFRNALAATQQTDLVNGGPYSGNTLENMADRNALLVQLINDALSRIPQLAPGDIGTGIDLTIPDVASRANRALMFDALGNVIAGTPITGATPAISAGDALKPLRADSTGSALEYAFDSITSLSKTAGTQALTRAQYLGVGWDLTGAKTADVVYEVPDGIPHMFVVDNQTTDTGGPWTVTVKHNGGAGVVVPINSRVILYSTGSAIEGVTAAGGGGGVVLLNGPLGMPSSGDLSNCTGGPTLTNATLVTPALGTPSSGTLDNCTGGPTLTSPTLVTPALGTPSSGTLDNCTGPWVSTYTLHVQDQKASGAQGGASAAATQNVRTLNTVVTNTITGASLATNQITLPAGTYRIWARAPAFRTNVHKIRLYNVTDAVVMIVGSSAYASATYSGSSDSFIQGYRFTVSGTKAVRLDHYTLSTEATNGLGLSTSSGDIEVYAEVMVIKE